MSLITCPNCNHQFEPNESIQKAVEERLRTQMKDWQRKKEEEYQLRDQQLQQQLQQKEKETLELRNQQLQQLQQKDREAQQLLEQQKHQLTAAISESIRRQMSGDYETRMKMMQEELEAGNEKLKEARQQQLEFIRKEQALVQREQELELSVQKKMLEERSRLSEQIRLEEAERNRNKETEYQLRLKELEEKFEQQKKLAEEMKRKAEQGSMQTQGEVLELMLEELLRNSFPFDLIDEVGKGVRGADCIQTVRNKFGQEVGRIIFESKRTQHFTQEWIEKLKTDLRGQGADLAVLVTQTMPKDMEQFGEKDGVWICTFSEARALVHVLREGMIRVHAATASQVNKGDKMHMLYDYLTSTEFREQWNAIREGFQSMRQSIGREREQMERLWKAREKQIEKVLLNMAHFKGSIEGISGQDIPLQLLEGNDDSNGE